MILAAVASYDLQAFDALQRVNACGTFVVNQQAPLQLRDKGAIVNFPSSAFRLALPSYAAHAASKGASDAITPVLARELSARDIMVNAIAPALERPGAAADITNLVAFLVSEDGRWVNGQAIRANGVIGSQTQGHGPGISRVRGTARSATPIRSTSTPGGQDEHHSRALSNEGRASQAQSSYTFTLSSRTRQPRRSTSWVRNSFCRSGRSSRRSSAS
jgi:hypothetical protein